MECFNGFVCLNGKYMARRYLLGFSHAIQVKNTINSFYIGYVESRINICSNSDFLLMLLVCERGVLKSLPLSMDLSFWFYHFLHYTFGTMLLGA